MLYHLSYATKMKWWPVMIPRLMAISVALLGIHLDGVSKSCLRLPATMHPDKLYPVLRRGSYRVSLTLLLSLSTDLWFLKRIITAHSPHHRGLDSNQRIRVSGCGPLLSLTN